MVKQRVREAQSSVGEIAVGKALGELERVALHRVRGSEAIEAICREVITRVDGIADLIEVTPKILSALNRTRDKSKKATLPPLELTETEVNMQRAKIGIDWNSASWELNPPRGWAWREVVGKNPETQEPIKEVVALVYEMVDKPNSHTIFIDRKIYEHPFGALALIKNVNKRHKALMAGSKEQRKGKGKKKT